MPPTSSNYPAPPDPRDVPPYSQQPPQQPINPYPAQEFGPPPPQPTQREGAEYNFILNQQTAQPKMKFSLGGGSSIVSRLLLYLGGFFVLLIIVVFVKNTLGGSSGINKTDYLTIAEDQQELVHVATEAIAQQGVDATTLETASTIEASLTSDQSRILAYLKTNHVKVNPATLNVKESKTTDSQLTSAAQSGLYDQTYTTIIQSQLSAYEADLQQTYNVSTGQVGKKLLKSEYSNAQLLVTQLTSPIG